jgi:choice-of-anchor A domain-containing protein
VRFRPRSFRPLLLAALIPAGLNAQTLIDDLNGFVADAGGYNLVTFGEATLGSGSVTEGGMAVGGDLTVLGGTAKIANSGWTAPTPSLYVGGALSLTAKTVLESGDASAADAGNASNWTWYVNKKGTVHELQGVADSSDLLQLKTSTTDPLTNAWTPTTGSAADFSSIAAGLAAADATGTISVGNNGDLTFTPPADVTGGPVYFDLDASLLNAAGDSYDGSAFSTIKINVPTGIDYIINLVGAASDQTLFSGVNFNSGTNDNQLLWNFADATGTVTLANSKTFYGAILAPRAAIADNAAAVSGQVVAASLNQMSGGTGQKLEFSAFTVLVPECPAFAWWALGLCAAGVVVRRARLRRRGRDWITS